MSASRRLYIAVADAFKNAELTTKSQEQLDALRFAERRVASAFKSDNSGFDTERFLKACNAPILHDVEVRQEPGVEWPVEPAKGILR